MSVQREHWVAVAWAMALVGLLVAVVALAVWWVTPREKPKVKRPAPAPIAVVPSSTPTPAVVPTSSVESTTTTATAAAPITRASLFAYRLGGAIWVAGEHGGASRTAFGSASGPFALAPDGVVLAVADSATESMTVIDLATAKAVRVGSCAATFRPSWSPDSQWLLYARKGHDEDSADYVKVRRDGTESTNLVSGQAAAWRIGGEGVVIAGGARGESGDLVWIRGDGSKKRLRSQVSASSVAAGDSRVYYATRGTVDGSGKASPPQIRSIDYSGRPRRTILAEPMDEPAALLTDLTLSPDGRHLAWTEVGDDGYSRIWAVKLSSGKPATLSPRRDGYIIGWSADGKELLFVEGNALVEEPTRVMAAQPDGESRRTLIDGGGL